MGQEAGSVPVKREGIALFGRRIGPVTVLLLLSPFVAEILSGASFPLLPVVFPPFMFLDLGLYGCGAVLIREAVVRWGRGWPSILALGVAFAFLEEGLVVASFTDPLSPARQALDASGYAYQTMRTLTYVQAGEQVACVGCHESRQSAPFRSASSRRFMTGSMP